MLFKKGAALKIYTLVNISAKNMLSQDKKIILVFFNKCGVKLKLLKHYFRLLLRA